MTVARTVYHLARADFKERVRRYSFFVTLAVTVLAAYLFLPPNHGSYVNLQMGGHRGIYNSAWVGTVMSIMANVFLFLVGFFLVRNTISRDRATGVGEIIAATPVRKEWYTLGKALSNFAVFVSIVIVLATAGAVMQLVRGESYAIAPAKLLMPFLTVTLPVAAVISAAAILSESIRLLRGVIGGVLWLVLWVSSLTTDGFGHWDIYGMTRAMANIKTACAAAFTNFTSASGHSIGFNFHDDGSPWNLTTFTWNGVPLTQHFLIQRLELVAAAIVLAAAGALFFDRFKRVAVAGHERISARLSRRLEGLSAQRWFSRASASTFSSAAVEGEIPLTRAETGHPGWLSLFRAEWRLLLYHHGTIWQLAAVGLMIASIFSPLEVVRNILWPIAWFWPVQAWSALGNRETQNHVDQIVFSTPKPIVRQLLMSWLAGVALAMVLAAPVASRLLLSGDLSATLAWCVGAAFVPALAIAFGVWSGSGRLFEVLYMLLMYLCAYEHIPMFDFMGITGKGIVVGRAMAYALLTVALILLAIMGRRRQLQH